MNKQKRKGSDWERQAADLLNMLSGGRFKRIVGSGAIGTLMGESLLTGDLKGEIKGFPKNFKIECKTGYGEGQMAIKKEWLDKIKEEAETAFCWPMLFGKFSGARSGVKSFIIIDYDTFKDLMDHVTKLSRELDAYYDK
jgi:hypothetical protein